MINERSIAEKFSAVWKQCFPLLNSNFIKVFNEVSVTIVNKQAVELIDNVRYDLTAEAAFNLSEILYNQKSSPTTYLKTKNNFLNLIETTAKNLNLKKDFISSDLVINQLEVEEVIKLTNNYLEFIKQRKKSSIEFRPKVKGYGFIPDLFADLIIDNTLYEVKTVNRNFKSTDLKQLLIYLALRQVSADESKFQYGGLYNPRKGVCCEFKVKTLVNALSGGNSPRETFENFLNSLVRDVQIDSVF